MVLSESTPPGVLLSLRDLRVHRLGVAVTTPSLGLRVLAGNLIGD